jgi:hypothetical protein
MFGEREEAFLRGPMTPDSCFKGSRKSDSMEATRRRTASTHSGSTAEVSGHQQSKHEHISTLLYSYSPLSLNTCMSASVLFFQKNKSLWCLTVCIAPLSIAIKDQCVWNSWSNIDKKDPKILRCAIYFYKRKQGNKIWTIMCISCTFLRPWLK